MGCGDEKLSKYLTQTFTAHCNAMICQQVTLLGDAEWPKVADAVIEAMPSMGNASARVRGKASRARTPIIAAWAQTRTALAANGSVSIRRSGPLWWTWRSG